YRESLFGKGSAPKEHAGAISPEQFEQAIKAKARLPLAAVLRCRIRYFTDGAVLGGQAFVAQHLAHYRRKLHRRRHSAPRPLPALADWGGELTALRGLRKHPFGE
ncbi:MAG: transposase, partial [Opitutaceae bacterium]|nr:transposase [Opitutaceae bacterium]